MQRRRRRNPQPTKSKHPTRVGKTAANAHQAAGSINNAMFGVVQIDLALANVDLGAGAGMGIGDGFGHLDIGAGDGMNGTIMVAGAWVSDMWVGEPVIGDGWASRALGRW